MYLKVWFRQIFCCSTEYFLYHLLSEFVALIAKYTSHSITRLTIYEHAMQYQQLCGKKGLQVNAHKDQNQPWILYHNSLVCLFIKLKLNFLWVLYLCKSTENPCWNHQGLQQLATFNIEAEVPLKYIHMYAKKSSNNIRVLVTYWATFFHKGFSNQPLQN